jgi:hypothetical protein
MDPDEALKNAREAAKRLERRPNSLLLDDAVALKDAFEVLDHWLSKGGFLPQDWQQKK